MIEVLKRMSLTDAPKTAINALFNKFFSSQADNGAKRLTNDAIRWVTDRASDDPFFLFCNYTEPHLEYDPPSEFLQKELPDGVDAATARTVNQDQWAYVTNNVEMSEQDFEILRALYRAEVRYLDSQLARLFERLAREELLDTTAVILVSDHGENIGEHGFMDHQYCLYETLLHVPLLIRCPGVIEPGRTDALVETRRLYETTADIANIAGTESETAPSLTDADDSTEYAIAEYTSPQPSIQQLEEEYGPLDEEVRQYDRALRSVRNGKWKYIEGSDGASELYNLDTDPKESAPVENPNIRQELHEMIEDRRGALADPNDEYADINAASRQRLRDLGYL